MQYDNYIIQFFDDEQHLQGMTPVCVHEYYENDFMEFLEETEELWKVHDVKLSYAYVVDEENDSLIVRYKDVAWELPYDEQFGLDSPAEFDDYIQSKIGQHIFEAMKAA